MMQAFRVFGELQHRFQKRRASTGAIQVRPVGECMESFAPEFPDQTSSEEARKRKMGTGTVWSMASQASRVAPIVLLGDLTKVSRSPPLSKKSSMAKAARSSPLSFQKQCCTTRHRSCSVSRRVHRDSESEGSWIEVKDASDRLLVKLEGTATSASLIDMKVSIYTGGGPPPGLQILLYRGQPLNSQAALSRLPSRCVLTVLRDNSDKLDEQVGTASPMSSYTAKRPAPLRLSR